jgi:16S rRNA (guanine1207-N2)-methyltransferase
MERVSQLVLKNLSEISTQETLLVNPPRDDLFRQLRTANITNRIWTQDFGDFRWFTEAGATVEFGVLPDHQDIPNQIILFQVREKERLEMMLHFFAKIASPESTLFLIGENKSGIKSSGKRLDKYFRSVVKKDSARHCVLFQAGIASDLELFEPADYHQKWMLGEAPDEFRVVSIPGSFAHGRLDKGTKILLGVLGQLKGKHHPAGSVLDFGCGIGVIGISLLKKDPTINLTLLDSSALAMESARLSLQANGLQAELLASDGLDQITQRYNWIVSNPPFHRGVSTDYEVVRRFYSQSRKVLSRKGKIILVCNRHLPYEGWLGEHFHKIDNLHDQQGFKVLLASRPRTD